MGHRDFVEKSQISVEFSSAFRKKSVKYVCDISDLGSLLT